MKGIKRSNRKTTMKNIELFKNDVTSFAKCTKSLLILQRSENFHIFRIYAPRDQITVILYLLPRLEFSRDRAETFGGDCPPFPTRGYSLYQILVKLNGTSKSPFATRHFSLYLLHFSRDRAETFFLPRLKPPPSLVDIRELSKSEIRCLLLRQFL